MTAGFGALRDEHVDADRDLALGVRLGADERADEQAVLVREVARRRAAAARAR